MEKRVFNTTGVCNPNKHYMVDLTNTLLCVKKLVDDGKYFTINRARQFGKTTLLHALCNYLKDDYLVVNMDFQMQMSNEKYKSEKSFSLAFAKAFERCVSRSSSEFNFELDKFKYEYNLRREYFDLVELFELISNFCSNISKKVVLMIDEADSATNNQVFLDFLSQLRGYYINRDSFKSFHSVILVGVYNVRNLKRKIRSESEHKDNSPWNIAAEFKTDMSFSPSQISTMLKEYENDHSIKMDALQIAQDIYDYSGGYPYLVSRICQLLDEHYQNGVEKAWSHEGILSVIKEVVHDSNSLFDDMAKKIKDYPELSNMLHDILFCGKSVPFNLGTELISIGLIFGFLKDVNGQAVIANRIFEIWFYNYFISQAAIDSKTYDAGEQQKEQFITKDGLNIDKILKKFVEHFTQSFGSSTDSFVEENGRKLFLLYIRPLINGIGNYYIESRTRSMRRTDLIIDYKGKQYIIEMKIWHGEEYKNRGEEQLIDYLNDYNLKRGYMLSFNFNKNKTPGVREIHFKNHTLVEAVV